MGADGTLKQIYHVWHDFCPLGILPSLHLKSLQQQNAMCSSHYIHTRLLFCASRIKQITRFRSPSAPFGTNQYIYDVITHSDVITSETIQWIKLYWIDIVNLRILTFWGSSLRATVCTLSRRTWILVALCETNPAWVSIPRNISLACRDRSDSWCKIPMSVRQHTSSRESDKTGLRTLRPSGVMKVFSEATLTLNLLTSWGSTVLWGKGILKPI